MQIRIYLYSQWAIRSQLQCHSQTTPKSGTNIVHDSEGREYYAMDCLMYSTRYSVQACHHCRMVYLKCDDGETEGGQRPAGSHVDG